MGLKERDDSHCAPETWREQVLCAVGARDVNERVIRTARERSATEEGCIPVGGLEDGWQRCGIRRCGLGPGTRRPYGLGGVKESLMAEARRETRWRCARGCLTPASTLTHIKC